MQCARSEAWQRCLLPSALLGLKGNLAPEGAIVKVAGMSEEQQAKFWTSASKTLEHVINVYYKTEEPGVSVEQRAVALMMALDDTRAHLRAMIRTELERQAEAVRDA